MTASLEWVNLKAPEVRALGERGAIAIVPVGSVEQHGPHLPTQVDALIATEVARRAAALTARSFPVIVAPTVWSGLAEHHMIFGGTITLDLGTFLGLLRCVCRSLGRQGFRRVLLLNGHGGNVAALKLVVAELTAELGLPLATATYWIVAATEFGRILEKQPNVCHACEAETSMVLALRPELVDREAMMSVTAPTKGFGDVGGVYLWHSVDHWSETGVVGVPSAATAEKGERLLSAAAGVLAERLVGNQLWEK